MRIALDGANCLVASSVNPNIKSSRTGKKADGDWLAHSALPPASNRELATINSNHAQLTDGIVASAKSTFPHVPACPHGENAAKSTIQVSPCSVRAPAARAIPARQAGCQPSQNRGKWIETRHYPKDSCKAAEMGQFPVHPRKAATSVPLGAWNTLNPNSPHCASTWSKISAWMPSYAPHSVVPLKQYISMGMPFSPG